MKAVAIFPDHKETQLIDHPEPQDPKPHQVKLQMLDVGICGTDRHLCAFNFGHTPPDSEYLIIGHEALGKVVEVGSAVAHLQPGDLVVPEVRRPCHDPACRACRAGHQDFCYTGNYTERGIWGLHGYMTDLVVDDAQYVHFVPPELRQVAVLTEPLTIAEKAFDQALHIQQRLPWLTDQATGSEPGRGLTALVLGAGPIGLLGTMYLVHAGFTTYVYSRSPLPNEKAALVETIGATYISSTTTSVQQLAQEIGSIDLVYEALDAAPLTIDIMRTIGKNAIFVFTSSPNASHPPGHNAATALQNLTMNNQVILGTVNAGPATFTSAIKHLGIFQQRWPLALQGLITRRYPLDAYDILLQQKTHGIKHVIAISEA